MKAEIRLLKHLGFSQSAKLADGLDSFSIHLPNDSWNNPTIINCIDLKKYTDAYELVQQYNGLFEAKELIRISLKLTDELRILAHNVALVEEVENFNG